MEQNKQEINGYWSREGKHLDVTSTSFDELIPTRGQFGFLVVGVVIKKVTCGQLRTTHRNCWHKFNLIRHRKVSSSNCVILFFFFLKRFLFLFRRSFFFCLRVLISCCWLCNREWWRWTIEIKRCAYVNVWRWKRGKARPS